MGLGKTIEVLALILTHRLRRCVLPNPLPTIADADDQKPKKRRSGQSGEVLRRKRTDNDVTMSEEHAYATSRDEGEVSDSTTSKHIQQNVETNFDQHHVTAASHDITNHETFECICGENEAMTSSKKRHIVQCGICRVRQHAKCLNYQLSDPYRGQYFCPHCHVINPPIASGATLIVTPESISYQWVDEILKHVHNDNLSVFVYKGVHQSGYIQPQTLANQDLVITTYQVLCKELSHVDLPHSKSQSGRRMRHPKRYMAKASPLVAVQWWRVCLDEAQMVGVTTRKMAQMAMRLRAVNKWCVTGVYARCITILN